MGTLTNSEKAMVTIQEVTRRAYEQSIEGSGRDHWPGWDGLTLGEQDKFCDVSRTVVELLVREIGVEVIADEFNEPETCEPANHGNENQNQNAN
tara:strand:+ start:1057 stop:1338 length:282 start_codon:yes stop_codon:yes gene_type:complete